MLLGQLYKKTGHV